MKIVKVLSVFLLANFAGITSVFAGQLTPGGNSPAADGVQVYCAPGDQVKFPAGIPLAILMPGSKYTAKDGTIMSCSGNIRALSYRASLSESDCRTEIASDCSGTLSQIVYGFIPGSLPIFITCSALCASN